MPGKRPRDIEFPPDEVIVAAVREHGTNKAAALALGYSVPYWDKVIGERGLRETCRQARIEHNAATMPPPAREKPERAGAEVNEEDGKATIVAEPSAKPQDIPALLKHWDLNPDEWEVYGSKVNTWDALTSDKATGDNRVVRMHQLTLHLRKRLELTLLPPAVHVPALVRPRPARRDRAKPRLIVVEGDHQAPYFDEDLDAAMTGFVSEMQPDEHVFLGDTGDYSTISQHPDHPAANAKPDDCLDATYALLRRRREAAPNARARKLKGNHDWRIDGYQLAQHDRLYGLRPAKIDDTEPLAAYSLRNLLHLDTLGIELVEDPRGWEHGEVELISGPLGLVVRHGWLTGHRTAERSMKKRGRSLIVGHGHHREHAFWWDPSAEVERQAAMCGVMCLARSVRFPHYVAADDQLQGALTVTVYPSGEFVIDHARWVGGRLVWRDSRWSAKRRYARAA